MSGATLANLRRPRSADHGGAHEITFSCSSPVAHAPGSPAEREMAVASTVASCFLSQLRKMKSGAARKF
jgi:hypothetical protein